MKRVTAPLCAMGASFEFLEEQDRLPLTITSAAGLSAVDWPSHVASAQVKSAILLAGLTGHTFVQVTEPRRSRDHSERMLNQLGVSVISHAVAGGWRVELRDPPAQIEAFDFAFQADLSRDLFHELATLRFLDEGINVLFAGMSGTGKSHLAMALALVACVANRRVLYTTSASMLANLNASLADGTLSRAINPFVRADLLVIDEVGLEQVESRSAARSGLMQKVLFPRYDHARSTIITSNIPWEAWGDYLDDHLGAAAILDRLIHRSHVIVINGPSYREYSHQLQLIARSQQPVVGH